VKIGLISDTHGDLSAWQSAWDGFFSDADLIVHAGDVLYHGPKFNPTPGYDPRGLAEAINSCPVPVLLCRGNGDSDVDQVVLEVPLLSPYLFASLDGYRLLASHGHLSSVEELEQLGHKWNVDLVVSGHTHVCRYCRDDGPLVVNPGSPTYPLGKCSGLERRTVATVVDGEPTWYDLDTGEELAVPNLHEQRR
jgi:hypothetical protein